MAHALKNVGSLGFEPRLPTFWTENSIPQAGILDQARLRPHSATSTPTPQSPNIEQEIIKTIVKCTASGLSDSSFRSISYTLKQISKAVDLMKPEEAKAHISTMRTVKRPHRPFNNAAKTETSQQRVFCTDTRFNMETAPSTKPKK